MVNHPDRTKKKPFAEATHFGRALRMCSDLFKEAGLSTGKDFDKETFFALLKGPFFQYPNLPTDDERAVLLEHLKGCDPIYRAFLRKGLETGEWTTLSPPGQA